MYDRIIITDNIDTASDLNKRELAVLWDKEHDKENIISIPKYLDDNKFQVRKEFLQVLHDIEISNINGKSILKHLEIEDNFSYWWLTSLGQAEPFSNGKNIYEIIKLICLKNILDKYQFNDLIVDLKEAKNFKTIHNSLIGKNIKFRINISSKRKIIFKKINYNFMYLFLGIVKFCFYAIERTKITNNSKKINKRKSYNLYIYDVLTHFKIESNKFKSGYWTELKQYLDKSNILTCWNHFFFKNNNQSFKKSLMSCSKYDDAIKNNTHVIVDKEVNFKNFVYVFKKIIFLFRLYQNTLKNYQDDLFVLKGNRYNFRFFHLIDKEMSKSMFGFKAFLNIFYFKCLDVQISQINKDSVCIFIQENQPWEYALCYFWRKRVNNKIIGFPHTTLPFFDLRYFFSEKTFKSQFLQPHLPDIMAINGNDMKQKMLEFNYLPSKMVDVEALRYNYLEKIIPIKKKNKTKKLLIIGDLVREITENQLDFILEWKNLYKPDVEILFRPHPSSETSTYTKYNFLKFSNNSFVKDIEECDIFCVNNTTSAAADIYSLGLPLITYNDLKRINFSPLLGTDGYVQVNNIDDFNTVYYQLCEKNIYHNEFFYLNRNIPMWKNLLENLIKI